MPERGESEALDRVRTPLLTLITRESLDQDYEMVARRRGPGSDPEPGTSGRVAVVAVVALFGVLVTVAGVQTSRNAAVDDASRATLIDRIESRRAAVRTDQARLAELREENAAAEEALLDLGDVLNAVQATQSVLATQTGFVAVRGEGIRIEVDNAPYADSNALVRDSDLALLVNGLWEAGAEAISINGQRMTGMSAISNVSGVIEVNSVGIAPPYTVLVIGDSSSLAADLVNTESGLAFASIAAQYGITYAIDDVDDLRVPAAPVSLRRLPSALQGSGEDTGRYRKEDGVS